MNRADLIRELAKIDNTLDWTEKHLTLTNESYAALHVNEKVFYSPLTTQVHEASLSLKRVLEALREEEAA